MTVSSSTTFSPIVRDGSRSPEDLLGGFKSISLEEGTATDRRTFVYNDETLEIPGGFFEVIDSMEGAKN